MRVLYTLRSPIIKENNDLRACVLLGARGVQQHLLIYCAAVRSCPLPARDASLREQVEVTGLRDGLVVARNHRPRSSDETRLIQRARYASRPELAFIYACPAPDCGG